jgi:membrane-associated phospholipid phosphatase
VVTHLWWFVVVLGGALAVVGAVWLAQAGTPPSGSASAPRSSGLVVLGCAAALVVLALLYRVHGIANLDSRIVSKLVPDRNAALNGFITTLTTMGDLVPSYLIAGVLAILIFRRTARWTAWLLPVVVLVQVAIQSAFLNTFNDLTMAQLAPGIVLGGSDGIPSGSMARLLSLFLLAALLWRPTGAIAARRLVDLGAVLVFVELVTRLYLGRHFLADVLAGLLLGIVLTIAFGWLIFLADNRSRPRDEPDGEPAVDADPPARPAHDR